MGKKSTSQSQQNPQNATLLPNPNPSSAPNSRILRFDSIIKNYPSSDDNITDNIIIMFINSEKELVKIVVLLHIKLRNALKDREKEEQDGLKIILEVMNLLNL